MSTGKLLTPDRTKMPAAFASFVELGHTEHEIGRVGEVEIVGCPRRCGFDHAVARRAIGLKRARGIDDEVRLLGSKRRTDVVP